MGRNRSCASRRRAGLLALVVDLGVPGQAADGACVVHTNMLGVGRYRAFAGRRVARRLFLLAGVPGFFVARVTSERARVVSASVTGVGRNLPFAMAGFALEFTFPFLKNITRVTYLGTDVIYADAASVGNTTFTTL